MAVKDCDKISNILAVSIVAWDDDLARSLADLSKIKNEAMQTSRRLRASWEEADVITWLNPHQLELRASSADIKIRAIVQASILKWDKGNEALLELAKQIKKTKWSLWWWIQLLEMVQNAKMSSRDEVARLRDDSLSASDAMQEIKDWLAEFIASNYSIRQYWEFYWDIVSWLKADLKDKKITLKQYDKKIAWAHKQAMEKIAKWENPTGFVALDNERQTIKKVFWDDPQKAGKAWTQYIMAREFLADWWLDDWLLKAFSLWGERLLWELTPEWIAKCDDLDLLLAMAFTNTEQLYKDWILRDLYRDKLAVLSSWRKINEKNAKKFKTLIKVSEFAEEWATLSDVMIDNRAYSSMKQMGYNVNESEWRKIYNSLIDFAEKVWEEWHTLDYVINIAWRDMEDKDVIQLIYDITWDKNILQLMQAWTLTDNTVLSFALQKLMWNNKQAQDWLIKILQRAKEWVKITDSRWIFLKWISWMDVPADAKIWFYDYRKWLYYKDELSSSKANYMDKLAEKNKMKVDSTWISNLTLDTVEDTEKNIKELANKIKKECWWWYLIVTDDKYNDNPLLRKALNSLKEKDSVIIISPKWWMSSSFMMEWDTVYFKTIDNRIYDSVAGTISIQSLWEAQPTRELFADIYEAKTWEKIDKKTSKAKWKGNQYAATLRYNKELNNAAVKYFWDLLWVSWDIKDKEYVSRVQTLLSDMLWIDINTFTSFKDKSKLWQRIDKQLTLERLTAGRFDKEVVDMATIRESISNLSNDDLEKAITWKFWNLIQGWISNNENVDIIREAWLEYNTATSTTDLLTAKWKIISLANWWNLQSMKIDEIQQMFKNKTFADKYKSMFFSEQTVEWKDLTTLINQINADVFDWLSTQFAENLVRAWYSLPLLNPKTLVHDYLLWKMDLNSEFVQSFFYKNGIAPTKDNLNAIMDSMMPKEFRFNFNTYSWKLWDDSLVWSITRVVEDDNIFLPDSYSALNAIEDWWRWVIMWWREYTVLENMIDKYINTVLDRMSKWNLKFSDAQKLKQEFSYALDTFEQDYLLPKYWKFLTPQERQWIMWIKYSMPIWVSWQPYGEVEKMLRSTKERVMWSYRNTMKTMAEQNDINAAIAKWYDLSNTPEEFQKRVKKRREQLIASWATIKDINWDYVVYDVKETLWHTVNNLPENIQWVAWLRAIWKEWIDALTNQQAYILLRYLEATKALASTSNLAMQLMYKQSPQLAQYRFFERYAIDAESWLPSAMVWNSLVLDTFFDWIEAISTVDTAIKKDVFANVISTFREKWHITYEGLQKIIKEQVEHQVDELWILKLSPQDKETAKLKMENVYTNMFVPYTYLRDIPDGWLTMNGTKLVNVKGKVESTMKEAYEAAKRDLEAAGATDADAIQQAITVRLNDWQVLTLDWLAGQNIDSRKKQIFNDESVFVKWADDFWEYAVDESMTLSEQTSIKNAEKEFREQVQNDYLSTLQSLLNEGQIISDAERELMTSFMLDVRTDLRKYSLTSKLVDWLDALSWLNEEVARWIKNYLIWFRWTITFGKFTTKQIIERYKLVRDAYRWFYNMPLEQLGRIEAKNEAEKLALDTARYFKNLERLMWSADWVKWITTSAEANRAFYHLWEVFMNLSTDTDKWVKGIFSMLSAIEQNQLLKFFKFSNPWDASYFKAFKQNKIWESLWGYRDYVENLTNITREDFNVLFWTNFEENQFKRVIQWLSWFSMYWWTIMRRVNQVLDTLSWSRLVFRMAMSYPWQLLTIPQQWVAYFLKQLWFERELWIESMSDVDEIRETFWILDWAYNELNIWWKTNFNPDSKDVNAFYNRYWIPDVWKYYKDSWITLADDYVNMYAKLDSKYAKGDTILGVELWEIVRWFDPYKDNANNFIDWIFARNFKNVAFMKWLRDNSVMTFSRASDFLEFMNDATISAEVKSKLLDAIAASSWRNFRNILWLWFWWLDRAVWWAQRQNILFWLMQLFNFRWSRWQNIFKQSWVWIYNAVRWMASSVWWTKASKDEIARYIVNSPEFSNFTTALFNDLERAFKLSKYQDNGRWPDEDDDKLHYYMEYISFMWETMNMVSQRWQGIQSFWPARPFLEQWWSAFRSAMNPTIYKDTYWIWAWFNAIGKNFVRQRKPANWIAEAIWAYQSWWETNLRAYLQNRRFNLSFGSLRYMIDEDMNAYWYTYEITWQRWWIPWIVMWEAQLNSDKTFLYELNNNETWDTIKLAFGYWDASRDERKTYHGNLWKTFVNGSQFMSTLKNAWKVSPFWEYTKTFYWPDEFAEVMQKVPAGKEFYQKWYVIPKDSSEARDFFDVILKNAQYRPWSKQFNKSLMQFEQFWHMDWWTWNKADAEMELWLEHMKYKTNEHWEFVLKNWKKVVEEDWTALIKNIDTYYWNEKYVTNVIYNYTKSWLNNHSSDPNYPLYIKLLWQWRAHMIIENEMDARVKKENEWKKKDDKLSEAEFKHKKYNDMLFELWNSKLEWDDITFFEKLNRLDTDNATIAALKIIESQSSQEDRELIEKFFTVETRNIDGQEIETVSLSNQYKWILEQIGAMARALDEWNVDRMRAQASSLANKFKNDDPTWMVTANLIDSIYNRIYDSKYLTPEMKQEMMIGVFEDNKEFIQRNPTLMREMLWDDYDRYAKLMNEMLYNWDAQVISNYDSIVSSWNKDAEKLWKAASWLSKWLKNYMAKLWWLWWENLWWWWSSRWRSVWTWYKQFVPVKIKWADLVKELWLKWYSPSTKEIKSQIFWFKPTLDLSLAKDINRKVKNTKTQTIANKKQLSNIETKTEKALEAES